MQSSKINKLHHPNVFTISTILCSGSLHQLHNTKLISKTTRKAHDNESSKSRSVVNQTSKKTNKQTNKQNLINCFPLPFHT